MSDTPKPSKRSNATKAAAAAATKSGAPAGKKSAPAAKKPARRKKTSTDAQPAAGLSVGWRMLFIVQFVLVLGALYSCASGDKHGRQQHTPAARGPAAK